jgi:hypothetical protein
MKFFRKRPSVPLQSFKKFSNQHMVKNPFKPEEDPLSLSSKRILSKQDMQYCDLVHKKAARLHCLD